jgi:hypothetical protein
MLNLIFESPKIIAFAFSFLIASPSSALVDGKKLGEVLKIDKAVAIPSEYVGGCIFTGLGASIEYWHVISNKVCTNEIGDAWGKTAKLDKLLIGGNGFSIVTACASRGTSIHCKDKPKYVPFDHVGRCIMPVKRTNGYSGVFCIQGLPNKEADFLLRSFLD